MPEPRIDERELDRLLNDLVSGATPDTGYRLDTDTIDTVRKLHSLAISALPGYVPERMDGPIRTEIANLAAEGHPMGANLTSTIAIAPDEVSPFGPNGQHGSPGKRITQVPARRPRWPIAHFATAALIVLTLTTWVLLVRGIPFRDAGSGVPIQAPQAQPVTETLVDTVVSDLPGGLTDITLAQFDFPASRSTLTLSDRAEGPAVVAALTENLVTTVGGENRQLQAGEAQVITGNGTVANDAPAEAKAVVLTISRYATVWDVGPNLSWKMAYIFNTTAIPAGPARVVLERTTLAAGQLLPPFTATEHEWIGLFDGQLKVTLKGDGPSEWTSGKERSVLPNFSSPQLTPGWEVSIRNPGAEPVDVYRLIVEPKKIDLSSPESSADVFWQKSD